VIQDRLRPERCFTSSPPTGVGAVQTLRRPADGDVEVVVLALLVLGGEEQKLRILPAQRREAAYVALVRDYVSMATALPKAALAASDVERVLCSLGRAEIESQAVIATCGSSSSASC